jgi:hypothetical protein
MARETSFCQARVSSVVLIARRRLASYAWCRQEAEQYFRVGPRADRRTNSCPQKRHTYKYTLVKRPDWAIKKVFYGSPCSVSRS